MAHVLQGLTELDPEATVTSIDAVGAFDLISRRAMLEGLRGVDDAVLFHCKGCFTDSNPSISGRTIPEKSTSCLKG